MNVIETARSKRPKRPDSRFLSLRSRGEHIKIRQHIFEWSLNDLDVYGKSLKSTIRQSICLWKKQQCLRDILSITILCTM